MNRPRTRIDKHQDHILYTDNSRAKCQPLHNSVNILADTLAHRISNGKRR